MSTDPSTAADPAASTPGPAADAAADLSYLHPDNLRLGGIGVFAGDWAWTDGADGSSRIAVGFVGVLIDTWNGWAVFRCTREVAEGIVADQQQHRLQYRESLRDGGTAEADLDRMVDQAYTSLVFDGDTIVADQRVMYDDPEAIERITPDADGRYVVMGWNWCWEAVDPTVCDRVVGQLPPLGGQQEFVMLTHTPDLRMPHDRVRVVSLQQIDTHNGVAYTAQLALDGEVVGTIENDGNGGPTTYYSPNFGPFNWRDLDAFVQQCRRGGQPVSEEQALEALVDEFDLDQIVHHAAADGATVVRLLDEHGYQLDLLIARPAPRSAAQRTGLAGRLLAEHRHAAGVEWVIWSGRCWRYLTRVDGGDTPPSTTRPGSKHEPGNDIAPREEPPAG